MNRRQDQLDIRAKKAIIRMSNTLEDISQKLDYLIKKQGENCGNHRNNRWANGRF